MIKIQALRDGTESFNVSVHEAGASPVVLFAAGAGGLPERYATLLNTFVEYGSTVIAPHFERLASPFPTETELATRARRLSLALDVFAQSSNTVVGAGHSIGASTLVAMAGAHMWLGPGQGVNIAVDRRLARLALLAPPTGFFQAPGALDDVQVPIMAWVGTEDRITPPTQTERLVHAMGDRQAVDVRVTEGAGHFSFMDIIPPNTSEPLANKREFLHEYSSAVCRFLIG